jgi:hypothetical protein
LLAEFTIFQSEKQIRRKTNSKPFELHFCCAVAILSTQIVMRICSYNLAKSESMKRILLPIFLLLSHFAIAQLNVDTLAIQDFELVPQSPTWTFTGPVIYNSGFSSGTSAPPNSPIGIGGSRAWETTTNSGGLLLEFANVTVPSGYDSVRVHFNLAAMNLNGTVGGPDDLDYVLIAYSTDGGTSYTNRMRIRGAVANNSFWAYSATGVAKVFYTPATESLFQPLTTGLQTTLGYSNCEIVFPGSVTQVRMRITGRSSSSSDTWLVDNLLITGENNCIPSTATISPTACGSYLSPSGGNTWTTSGTYMDTIPNTLGCDSVITVNLTINANTGGSLIGTYCDSLLSPSGNHVWTMPGVYYDTIPNSAGCDSIILANIVVLQSSSSTISVTDCDSYVAPSGAALTTSGTYTDVIPNADGCDSVITIVLTLNTTPNVAVTQSNNTLTATATGAQYQWVDCNNGFALIGGATGQIFTPSTSGNYAVIVSANGCSDTSACTQVVVVGIEGNLGHAQVRVFPNPAGQVLVLQVPEVAAEEKFTVFDVAGRMQLSGQLVGMETAIDVSKLAAGIYHLQVGTGPIQRISFVKQ